jgi:hypothetical protein
MTEESENDHIEGDETLEVAGLKEVYPNATVKIAKAQYSLFELKRKYENKDRPEIILDPNFQRGDVWKKGKQKSELIESILMGIPLPVYIFLRPKMERKKLLMDDND